jgi:hypothetical protein
MLPGFLIELAGYAEGVLAQLWLIGFESSIQMCTQRIVLGSKFFDPLIHHLSIAKCAEFAEKFARDLAHRWPGGIGIYLFHDHGDGSAAANGHPQIVNYIGIGGGMKVFEFFKDALHPKSHHES